MNIPTKHKLGIAYIRESTEEQDKGFSPQNQEHTIREYAKKNNIEIIKIYKDLLSGKSATKRTDFQKMTDSAMLKEFEIILVFHTSRFARNVKEAREYKDLFRKKLGIDVVSVTQPFGDFNDPSSFLNEGVNELFDEHYSRQLSFWMRASLMEKRRQGKQNGNPPIGYYKKRLGVDENGKPIYASQWLVEKKTADLVKRIYTLYATGNYSMSEIAGILTKEGLKTNYGNEFTYSSIKGILQNKVYLGLVHSPRKELPDIKSTNHKAIISKDLYYKVQDKIHERAKHFGRPLAQHRFYLLQGLVFCYPCFKHIKGKESDDKARMLPSMYCHTKINKGYEDIFQYICKFRRENQTCTQPGVRCEIIDDQVIEFMNGFTLPEDIIKETLEKLHQLFQHLKTESKPDNRIVELQKRRKRVNIMFEAGELSDDAYTKRLQEIKEDIEKLERQGIVPNIKRLSEEQMLKKTEQYLRDYKAFWGSNLTKEERREWILLTIKRIWVKIDRVVAIEPRDDYKALFVSHKKVIAQLPVIAPL
ncbi:MAG: recombinase family protein [Parcubacteria group bacterium]|jgi:DNA invertase Pin-like site-specific DNA recombinase